MKSNTTCVSGKSVRVKPKKRNGFTMMEMMVTLAIMAILFGLAVPAVAVIQKNLEMARLNSYAKDVYLAAQSQLTSLKATGGLVEFREELEENYSGSGVLAKNRYYGPTDEHDIEGTSFKPQDWDDNWDKDESGNVLSTKRYFDFYGIMHNPIDVADNDAIVTEIIPEVSVTATTLDHHYYIEFNPNTGDVYAAFYTDAKSGFTAADIRNLPYADEENGISNGRVKAYLRDEFVNSAGENVMVGYYRGDPTKMLESKKITEYNVTCELVNKEDLYIKVTCELGDTYFLRKFIEANVTLTNADSGEEMEIPIDLTQAANVGTYQRTGESGLLSKDFMIYGYDSVATTKFVAYILLDALDKDTILSGSSYDSVIEGVADVYKGAEGNKGKDLSGFVEAVEKGCNLKASADVKLNFGTRILRTNPTNSTSEHLQNSRFASIKSEGDTETINVGYVRHLNNLNGYTVDKKNLVINQSCVEYVLETYVDEDTGEEKTRTVEQPKGDIYFASKYDGGDGGDDKWYWDSDYLIGEPKGDALRNYLNVSAADAEAYIEPITLDVPDGAAVTYNGKHYGLYDFVIDGADGSGATGLFGTLENATVNNVNLIDVTVDGGDATDGVGAFVGNADTCTFNSVGVRLTDRDPVNNKRYTNMTTRVDTKKVSSSSGAYVGGVAGYATNCYFDYSYAALKVEGGSSSITGGLAGYASDCDFMGCYTSEPTVGGQTVGGFVGILDGGVAIAEANGTETYPLYATGDVTGSEYVGGFVGYATDGAVLYGCNSFGRVYATEGATGTTLGGFAGDGSAAAFSDCSYLKQNDYNDSETLALQPEGVSGRAYNYDWKINGCSVWKVSTNTAEDSHPYTEATYSKSTVFPFAMTQRSVFSEDGKSITGYDEIPHYGDWPLPIADTMDPSTESFDGVFWTDFCVDALYQTDYNYYWDDWVKVLKVLAEDTEFNKGDHIEVIVEPEFKYNAPEAAGLFKCCIHAMLEDTGEEATSKEHNPKANDSQTISFENGHVYQFLYEIEEDNVKLINDPQLFFAIDYNVKGDDNPDNDEEFEGKKEWRYVKENYEGAGSQDPFRVNRLTVNIYRNGETTSITYKGSTADTEIEMKPSALKEWTFEEAGAKNILSSGSIKGTISDTLYAGSETSGHSNLIQLSDADEFEMSVGSAFAGQSALKADEYYQVEASFALGDDAADDMVMIPTLVSGGKEYTAGSYTVVQKRATEGANKGKVIWAHVQYTFGKEGETIGSDAVLVWKSRNEIAGSLTGDLYVDDISISKVAPSSSTGGIQWNIEEDKRILHWDTDEAADIESPRYDPPTSNDDYRKITFNNSKDTTTGKTWKDVMKDDLEGMTDTQYMVVTLTYPEEYTQAAMDTFAFTCDAYGYWSGGVKNVLSEMKPIAVDKENRTATWLIGGPIEYSSLYTYREGYESIKSLTLRSFFTYRNAGKDLRTSSNKKKLTSNEEDFRISIDVYDTDKTATVKTFSSVTTTEAGTTKATTTTTASKTTAGTTKASATTTTTATTKKPDGNHTVSVGGTYIPEKYADAVDIPNLPSATVFQDGATATLVLTYADCFDPTASGMKEKITVTAGGDALTPTVEIEDVSGHKDVTMTYTFTVNADTEIVITSKQSNFIQPVVTLSGGGAASSSPTTTTVSITTSTTTTVPTTTTTEETTTTTTTKATTTTTTTTTKATTTTTTTKATTTTTTAPTTKAKWAITVVNDTTKGAVSGAVEATEGDSVSLTVTPKAGWKFGGFTSSDVTVNNTASGGSFTMPNKAVTLTATYTADTTVALASWSTANGVATVNYENGVSTIGVASNTAGSGGLTFAQFMDSVGNLTASQYMKVTYTLSNGTFGNARRAATTLAMNAYSGGTTMVTSANDSTIVAYVVGASAKTGTNTFNVSWTNASAVPANIDVTATVEIYNFETSPLVGVSTADVTANYTVTVEGGTASPATAAANTSITVTPTVPNGKVFTGWKVDGTDYLYLSETDKTASPLTFTMPYNNVKLTAEFETAGTTGTTSGTKYSLSSTIALSKTNGTTLTDNLVSPMQFNAGETAVVKVTIQKVYKPDSYDMTEYVQLKANDVSISAASIVKGASQGSNNYTMVWTYNIPMNADTVISGLVGKSGDHGTITVTAEGGGSGGTTTTGGTNLLDGYSWSISSGALSNSGNVMTLTNPAGKSSASVKMENMALSAGTYTLTGSVVNSFNKDLEITLGTQKVTVSAGATKAVSISLTLTEASSTTLKISASSYPSGSATITGLTLTPAS